MNSEVIAFSNCRKLFPEHFSVTFDRELDSALEKYDSYKAEYKSDEQLFLKAGEKFTRKEIEAYALWRASVYYSSCPSNVIGTAGKVFNSIVELYRQLYLNLAGISHV